MRRHLKAVVLALLAAAVAIYALLRTARKEPDDADTTAEPEPVNEQADR